jgi:hypothetical protein|tara:strand:- start:185 stop:1867 length:1683 start_codon:yes stop_codon:yes gene_type:complete
MKSITKYGALATNRAVLRTFFLSVLGMVLASCGAENGTPTSILSNTGFSLYCPNVGIATSNCVLSDPENPYASQTVNDTTKWSLSSSTTNARAKFYVWATAMANNPTGENQYNTALSLHELYHADSNILAQAQAKLAYRSVLDNYFTASNSVSEFVAGTDFSFGDWGSASTLDGSYTADTDYDKVYQVAPGWGWGGNTAALAMTNFSAGFAANYQNLVFKIKSLPTGDVYVKFPLSGAGNGGELALSLATYGAAVPGTTGWTQVIVPLSVFNGAPSDTEFGIHGGYGNGGTFLISDIGFTGDATGNGMVGDVLGDGIAAIYAPVSIHDGKTSTSIDFVSGTDFTFGEWGSGGMLNGSYTADSDYSPVFQVAPGWNWGASSSALAMSNFSAGFAANYQNLVFKVKSLPTGNVIVKFPLSGVGNNGDGEVVLALTTYGTAIPGATGWTQVVIPLSVFNGAASDTEFGIMGGWGSGGTFLVTDIGFTGNTTSANMMKDSIDGFVAVYYPQTESLSQVGFVRGLAGEQLVEPDTLTNLYGSQSEADAAVTSWGFTYNTTSNTLQ